MTGPCARPGCDRMTVTGKGRLRKEFCSVECSRGKSCKRPGCNRHRGHLGFCGLPCRVFWYSERAFNEGGAALGRDAARDRVLFAGLSALGRLNEPDQFQILMELYDAYGRRD